MLTTEVNTLLLEFVLKKQRKWLEKYCNRDYINPLFLPALQAVRRSKKCLLEIFVCTFRKASNLFIEKYLHESHSVITKIILPHKANLLYRLYSFESTYNYLQQMLQMKKLLDITA